MDRAGYLGPWPTGLFVLALFLICGGVFPGQVGAVEIPSAGASLRVTFGLKDKAPTAWDGDIKLSQGKVVAFEVKTLQAGSAKKGNSWKLRTRAQKPRGQQSVHDPKLQKYISPVLVITVGAPAAARATINTPHGQVVFALSDVALGTAKKFLQGQVQVERLPLSVRLTDGPDDEDLPAAVKASDGTVWVVYSAYKHAPPLDVAAIHDERKFAAVSCSTGVARSCSAASRATRSSRRWAKFLHRRSNETIPMPPPAGSACPG